MPTSDNTQIFGGEKSFPIIIFGIIYSDMYSYYIQSQPSLGKNPDVHVSAGGPRRYLPAEPVPASGSVCESKCKNAPQ